MFTSRAEYRDLRADNADKRLTLGRGGKGCVRPSDSGLHAKAAHLPSLGCSLNSVHAEEAAEWETFNADGQGRLAVTSSLHG